LLRPSTPPPSPPLPLTLPHFYTLAQHLFRYALYHCGRSGGLWSRKSLEGTLEDEVGTRLVMAEGSEGALALERIELAAMNSERFRMRFLDRARPWLLSQLPQILTPRIMQRQGVDGRPVIELVRDVYEQLISMSEHAKVETDKRSSQLTGEDAEEQLEEEERTRQWRALPGPSQKSKKVAEFWLGKARRVILMRKTTLGVRENSRREKCDLCGKHESDVGRLRCDMAKGGRYDPYAFDNLVSMYETRQSRAGFDVTAPVDESSWRSFFRSNATFFMRCEFCVARTAETARLVGQIQEFGREARAARMVARNAELALQGLEEEDEELTWAPVPIHVESNAGRALKKWLSAARVRIGGVFPKPQAAEEVKKYAALAEANKARKAEKLANQKARVLWTAPEKVGQVFVGKINVSPSATAIAQLWLFSSQGTMSTRFQSAMEAALVRIETALPFMTPTLDWHFTAEARLVGAGLIGDGRKCVEALKVLAKIRDEGIRIDTRELVAIVARADAEIARSLEELEARTSSMAVVFTTDEIKTLEKTAAKIANLEERVGELPETSSAAADVRHRMEALRNQGSALRASAVIMRAERIAVLKRSVEAQIRKLRVFVAERKVKHSRKLGELKAAYFAKSKLAAAPWLNQAREWLEAADAKLATLKDAQRARGRFGLTSLLGGGRGSPKSPTPASAASPRSPPSSGAATPRAAASARSVAAGGRAAADAGAAEAAAQPRASPGAASPARAVSPA
jgi:hypothetical protein